VCIKFYLPKVIASCYPWALIRWIIRSHETTWQLHLVFICVPDAYHFVRDPDLDPDPALYFITLLAFKKLTKNKFFKFKSVFKDNQLLKSHKTEKSRVFLTFLLWSGTRVFKDLCVLLSLSHRLLFPNFKLWYEFFFIWPPHLGTPPRGTPPPPPSTTICSVLYSGRVTLVILCLLIVGPYW
jgi:hypothetical protein